LDESAISRDRPTDQPRRSITVLSRGRLFPPPGRGARPGDLERIEVGDQATSQLAAAVGAALAAGMQPFAGAGEVRPADRLRAAAGSTVVFDDMAELTGLLRP
jgi:hypothetical protein